MGFFDWLTGKTEPTTPGSSQSSSSEGSSHWSSSSSSSFQNPDFVWGGQSPYLEGLYGGASDLMNSPQYGQMMNNANDIFGSAQQAYDRMLNPGINPQLQAYAGDVQQNFERNIMPAIGGQAAGFGQYGGGRQGVAEGIAAGDANRQVTNMASNLYNQDQNRVMQAMQFGPQLGAFGMGIPWFGMQNYAGILGSPTTLGGAGGSESSSAGGGSSWGESSSSGTTSGGGGGYPGFVSIGI